MEFKQSGFGVFFNPFFQKAKRKRTFCKMRFPSTYLELGPSPGSGRSGAGGAAARPGSRLATGNQGSDQAAQLVARERGR